MNRLLRKAKELALPLAILVGMLLHKPLTWLAPLLPYMVVAMLFFTCLKLSPREMRLKAAHIYLFFLQIALATGSFALGKLFMPDYLAQGFLNCFLCPAASASPVVIAILGGSIAVGTTYVLLSSVGVALVAPLIFSWVAPSDAPFFSTVWYILCGVVPLVGIPLVAAFSLRRWWPTAKERLLRYPAIAFWIWVAALALIIARTTTYVLQELPQMGYATLVAMLGVGLLCCLIQFALGKMMSKTLLGESVTLGQSLGQKNTTLAIWMAQTYLNPLSSVPLAAYSIWQNILNAIQIAQHQKSIKNSL